ncbi:MAG: phospholipid-binding protein [Xenococcaceae cyanobacterium]
MGWLKRLFGLIIPGLDEAEEGEEEGTLVDNASVNPEVSDDSIPPERIGLDGNYDQSGLAKRVVLAFDEDPDLDDEGRLWVAQTGSTVVLKGTVSSQEVLDKMVEVAESVYGATEVDTEEVAVE